MKRLFDTLIILTGIIPVLLLVAGTGSVVDILLSFWFETCLMVISFIFTVVLNRRFGTLLQRIIPALGLGLLLTVYISIQFQMIHTFFPSLEISRVLISISAMMFIGRYTLQMLIQQRKPLRYPNVMAAFGRSLKYIFISNATILAGAVLTLLLGNNLGFIVAAIGVKTYFDLRWAHERVLNKLLEIRPTL